MKTSLVCAPAGILAFALSGGIAPETLGLPPDVHQILFLGDSITQGGDYVTDVECWLLAHGARADVLNLGLSSETATDLTPAENAGHEAKYGFGRPFLSERYGRILASVHPDLLVACYGMNDGGSLPASEEGLRRFADAVTVLRDQAIRAGIEHVLICTPPVHDARGDAGKADHDANLARYSGWLLAQRENGWHVVDIHGLMRRALDEGRATNPEFALAADGVHPGREGHWLMARQIIDQYLGGETQAVSNAEALFASNGAEIRQLVRDRMVLRHAAWMTRIGHKRPGVPGGPGAKPGLSVAEAEATAAEIQGKIQALLPAASP